MTDPDLLYTSKEAADMLGVSPRTLRRWQRAGTADSTIRGSGPSDAHFFDRRRLVEIAAAHGCTLRRLR